MPRMLAVLPALMVAGACSSSSSGPSSSAEADSGTPSDSGAGVTVLFDAAADLTSSAHFFDFPWPSDLRLSSTGTPALAGLPNPTSSGVLEGLRTIAEQRPGFPMVPVAWFRFTADVAAHVPTDTIPAAASSPILLVDVGAGSAGKLLPTIAETITPDGYVPTSVLAVGVRPGIVLTPNHPYAFVVMRSANDATGKPLGVAPALAAALSGGTDAVGKLYSVLPSALKAAGVDASQVAAATVFTTGDVVDDLFQLSTKVVSSTQAAITSVAVDSYVKDSNARFCELTAKVTYPQFQVGYASPPYDKGGLFSLDSSGAPIKQGDLTVPLHITLPKQQMPSGGFPLIVYFHGTGGLSNAIADRGVWRPETNLANCPPEDVAVLGNLEWSDNSWNGVNGCNTPGQGPAWVMAAHGVAMAAAALPLNPERWLAGQNSTLPEYIDINNVAATRDDFRQGVIESRLFVDALGRLTIPPSVVAACTGLSLPAGETAYHFDPQLAQGQSMGAMYANMVSAVEPRIKAVVPTGSGGYWSWFILQTQFIPNIKGELGLLLGIHGTTSRTCTRRCT